MSLPGADRLGPARLVVTDRRNGVSRPPWDSLNLADHVGDDQACVAENRRRVYAHLGVAEVAVIDANHGRGVHVVDSGGTPGKGDALITSRPGLGLLALGADCVAGVVVAPDIVAVAAVHCGWRGLAAGIVPAVIGRLAALGADPGRLLVHLGPAICPACYEVSVDVRDEVAAAAPAAAARTADGAPAVDLIAGVRWQLAECGVSRTTADGRCTAQSPDLFSHRRDGRTGRQGVLAVLEERR